jgi:hypothetical protein
MNFSLHTSLFPPKKKSNFVQGRFTSGSTNQTFESSENIFRSGFLIDLCFPNLSYIETERNYSVQFIFSAFFQRVWVGTGFGLWVILSKPKVKPQTENCKKSHLVLIPRIIFLLNRAIWFGLRFSFQKTESNQTKPHNLTLSISRIQLIT